MRSRLFACESCFALNLRQKSTKTHIDPGLRDNRGERRVEAEVVQCKHSEAKPASQPVVGR